MLFQVLKVLGVAIDVIGRTVSVTLSAFQRLQIKSASVGIVRDSAVPKNKRMSPKGSYGIFLTWG